MMRGRRGFTFIEMLVVMIVIGLLASIGLLRYMDLKHRATSARVASDLTSVRLAAYGVYHSAGAWPAEQAAGVVPPELLSELRGGFRFDGPDYTLDWENLGGGGTMQIGVTVTSSSTRLMTTLGQTLAKGNQAPFIMVGNQLTMVIVGPDGRS